MADRKTMALWGAALPLVFAAALALRLYPVLARPETDRFGFGPFGDTFLYYELAVNLCEGNGFAMGGGGAALTRGPLPSRPAFQRGPGYPLFMASVFCLTRSLPDTSSLQTVHRALDRVRIAQCLLDALCAVLVFGVARLFMPASRWAPLCSAALYAACPYAVSYSRALLAESFTAFSLTLFILCAVRGIRDGGARDLFYAGLSLGFVDLCRPEYLVFLAVFAAYLCLVRRTDMRRAVRLSCVCLAGALCILAPWTARNWLVLGRPIPTVKGLPGLNLYLGAVDRGRNWRGWGVVPGVDFVDEEERTSAPILFGSYYRVFMEGGVKEFERIDRAFARLALRRMRARPAETLRNWVARLPRLWFLQRVPLFRDPEAGGGWFALCFLGSVAAWCAVPSGRARMGVVVLLFVYLNLVFLPLFVEPRYGVPLMPGIAAMAGAGICAAGERARRAMRS